MSTPKHSAAYPSAMLTALTHCLDRGEFVIPCEKPLAMRLQFQGLRGALRKEKKAEIIDMISFHIQAEPPALILRLKDQTSMALEIQAALTGPIVRSAADLAEESLARILGGKV